MAEYLAGPTMVLTWTYSGGTISLAGDYRTCTFSGTTGYEDASAGSDTQVGRLPTLTDVTASVELVLQTGGTAIQAALQPKTAGTLVIQPEGTATNKRKITIPAYCDGAVPSFPYAGVAVITCGFTGSSTLNTYTDGVNA
jgi:hypothetical protein